MAASGNRIAWLYTDNFGTVGRVTALKHLTDQGVCGGSAASGFEAPSGVRKMRKVQVVTATGVIRYVPVYEETATAWTTVGTPVTIQINDVEVAASTTGLKETEKNRRAAHQTT